MRRIYWIVVDLILCLWLFALGLIGPWANRHLARRRGTGPGRPVLLLHGYAMGRGTMIVVGNHLAREQGAPVVALGYGWLFSMDRAARRVAAEASRLAREAGVPLVDVVAHSLGGLVARHARELAEGAAIGRIVTLGTPHRGAWPGAIAIGSMRGEIRRGCSHPARTGDLAITSHDDNLIPWRQATLDPPGESKVIDGCGHAGILLAGEPTEEDRGRVGELGARA
jgi:pimeloyl-ACP methyl ester carboxylesterase